MTKAAVLLHIAEHELSAVSLINPSDADLLSIIGHDKQRLVDPLLQLGQHRILITRAVHLNKNLHVKVSIRLPSLTAYLALLGVRHNKVVPEAMPPAPRNVSLKQQQTQNK